MLNAYYFIANVVAGLKAKQDEKGATATEYALLVAFIAIVLFIGVGLFGTSLNTFFSDLKTSVDSW